MPISLYMVTKVETSDRMDIWLNPKYQEFNNSKVQSAAKPYCHDTERSETIESYKSIRARNSRVENKVSQDTRSK